MPTYEKFGRHEIRSNGRPLGYWNESDENPFIRPFKILAHVSDVQTALSFYGAFQKILDRLPDGANFTDNEIREWLRWKTAPPGLNKEIAQGEGSFSILRDLPNLVFGSLDAI